MLGIKTVYLIDTDKFTQGNEYYLNGVLCTLETVSEENLVFVNRRTRAQFVLTVKDVVSGKFTCTTKEGVTVIGYEQGFDV